MSREVFTTCNPLAVSCVLYQEEARTNLWGAGTYYDGVTCWVVNSSGVITGTATCTPFYEIIFYGTTTDEACFSPISNFPMTGNGTTFCNSTTFTSASWNAIATGNYILEFSGQIRNVSHTSGQGYATTYDAGCGNCPTPTPTPTPTNTPTPTPTPTPTNTPTPTPSPAPGYDYYLASEYTCFPCTFSQSDVLVGFVAGTSINSSNWYYARFDGEPFVYKNFTSTSSGSPAVLLVTTNASTNCGNVCST